MYQFDIDQLRRETPGCQHVLHFNNAGASLPPKLVIDTIKQHLDLEATRGGYEAYHLAEEKNAHFYENAALLINSSSEEIAFMENATRAWSMAFSSFKFNRGDKILTCVSEYASNYMALLHQAKHNGIKIEIINDDASGQIDLNDLRSRIDAKVKLIAITHVPTQGGLINPAAEVGKIAKANKIPYLLDATQSVGQMPIDVDTIGCDFLSATGRKFLRGPRGTGFLFARKDFIERYDPPFVALQATNWIADNEYIITKNAVRFETWEQSIALKIGLNAAIQYALKLGLAAIWERIQYLSSLLRQKLSQINSIELRDLGIKQCGIVTFTSSKKSPQEIQQYLSTKCINVSIPLQEYARLDLAKRNLEALVRASVHYFNTESEIDIFCFELRNFLGS
jgi:selenocysteine lyase/cysteine desulfurase